MEKAQRKYTRTNWKGFDWASLDPQIIEMCQHGLTLSEISMKLFGSIKRAAWRKLAQRVKELGGTGRICTICKTNVTPGVHINSCRVCAPTDDFRWICNRYGIGKPTYDLLMQACDGKCSICLRPFTEECVPYIDHDHQTDIVRGLLCNRCNRSLFLIEDFDRLRRMLNHIQRLDWMRLP
jgi:hypothetical protein